MSKDKLAEGDSSMSKDKLAEGDSSMSKDKLADFLSKRDYRLVKTALTECIERPRSQQEDNLFSEADWEQINAILANMSDREGS